jgi:hypothetical protein
MAEVHNDGRHSLRVYLDGILSNGKYALCIVLLHLRERCRLRSYSFEHGLSTAFRSSLTDLDRYHQRP